ncbi:heavy-metal-associated domain-containing protein [Haloimpatiens sp. FM7330]|uniref:heavy-metal-associated domain-containing protein n=1 Tax=Haloimpatiens sp. FM7330 TaxID=3298610 RepID=UPI0036288C7B
MKKKLLIDGMSCGHCAMRVKNVLSDLKSVNNVDVNLDKKSALIDMKDNIEDSILKETVEEAGYDVISIEKE